MITADVIKSGKGLLKFRAAAQGGGGDTIPGGVQGTTRCA